MREGIHPTFYADATFTCGSCGTTWQTGSTKKIVHVDVCSNCHPFFTGTQRIVDTAGQVERFTKRLAARESAVETGQVKGSKRQRRAEERIKRSGMLEAMQPEPASAANETPVTAAAKAVGGAVGTAEAIVEQAGQAIGEGLNAAAETISNAAGAVTGRKPRPARPPRERKPAAEKTAEPSNEGAAAPESVATDQEPSA